MCSNVDASTHVPRQREHSSIAVSPTAISVICARQAGHDAVTGAPSLRARRDPHEGQ
jgi:hypothetical protein